MKLKISIVLSIIIFALTLTVILSCIIPVKNTDGYDTYITSSKTKIYSLQMNNNADDAFMLGRNTTDSATYYYYYTLSENGYILNKSNSINCDIILSLDEETCVEVLHKREKLNKLGTKITGNKYIITGETRTEIIVPENYIMIEYCIDE